MAALILVAMPVAPDEWCIEQLLHVRNTEVLRTKLPLIIVLCYSLVAPLCYIHLIRIKLCMLSPSACPQRVHPHSEERRRCGSNVSPCCNSRSRKPSGFQILLYSSLRKDEFTGETPGAVRLGSWDDTKAIQPCMATLPKNMCVRPS